MNGIRAVFFDLDDTLCGYWDASKAGLRAAFAEAGAPGVPVEEMVGHWGAAFREFCPQLETLGFYARYLQSGEPSRTELMRRVLLRVGIDDPAHARRLGDAYAHHRDANLRLFPEAREVVDTLKGRGYRLGLITNGPADIQRQEIATCGLDGVFDPVLIEGEMGFGKPTPEVFRIAERLAGAGPGEILFVGNSYRHDIEAGAVNGWRTAWVRRPSDVPPSAPGVHAKPEERPENGPVPDLEIRDLRELLPLLKPE